VAGEDHLAADTQNASGHLPRPRLARRGCTRVDAVRAHLAGSCSCSRQRRSHGRSRGHGGRRPEKPRALGQRPCPGGGMAKVRPFAAVHRAPAVARPRRDRHAMTDDKKPEELVEIDWDEALAEWEKTSFVPEVAKDVVTDKPAALAGSVRPLYRPPTAK